MFHFWYALITIVVIMVAIPGGALYLVLLERKISAWVQDRLGPNRVGKFGLFQPIADAFKLLFKEQLIPDRVDKVLYLAAPGIAVATTMLAFAVVPFGRTTVPANENTYQFVIAPGIDIGIVFIFAVSSLTVYAVLLSGWSSNNKFSFIGGLRSSAQLISYEIPMGMSILGVVLMAGSLDLSQIIEKQTENCWNIFFQPLAFLLFLTSAFAECNRLPFDLPEAEQELVGGYHTEYSALKFVLFYLGEYTHLVTTSFLFVILFFGGWHFPWIAEAGPGGVVVKLVSVRPAHGPGLESAHPAGVGQPGMRDGGQTVEVESLVAFAGISRFAGGNRGAGLFCAAAPASGSPGTLGILETRRTDAHCRERHQVA
jgi:NADH-quinone oxidoreductase subunit H